MYQYSKVGGEVKDKMSPLTQHGKEHSLFRQAKIHPYYTLLMLLISVCKPSAMPMYLYTGVTHWKMATMKDPIQPADLLHHLLQNGPGRNDVDPSTQLDYCGSQRYQG